MVSFRCGALRASITDESAQTATVVLAGPLVPGCHQALQTWLIDEPIRRGALAIIIDMRAALVCMDTTPAEMAPAVRETPIALVATRMTFDEMQGYAWRMAQLGVIRRVFLSSSSASAWALETAAARSLVAAILRGRAPSDALRRVVRAQPAPCAYPVPPAAGQSELLL